ncbi:MAG: thioesterase family protein [Candidatus Omnitrophica bacterium]|nr:thioesterase family protein [Candidatus Omnitrophota bacterium]
MKKRIYYHDTDCGGVVYYANYLKYLEEARTEFFEKKGFLIKDLAEQGILFVVAHHEIDYKSPGVYGDVLDIETRVSGISGVKIEFEYEVRNEQGRLITEAKTTLVCVDKKFKPRAIPPEMRQKIASDKA